MMSVVVGVPLMASRPKTETPKATMHVAIDQHFKAKVYTSGSTISGHVTVRAVQDLALDNFEILFTGIAATRLEFLQQYPSFCFRPFMKLRMPIQTSDLPSDRIFRAGQDYRIPFHFVVPHQLTIGACNHCCTCHAVREQHLRLPPSMGAWDADDQAPDMTHIEYAIKARIIKNVPGGAGPVKLVEGHHTLKVLPALPEDAPLAVSSIDERYRLSRTRTIRKSLFSTKTGLVTATSSQPEAIMLSADGYKASTSSVNVHLEYVPSSMDTPPPKINSVTGKLISTTFFSAVPISHLPNLGSRTKHDSSPCLSYLTTSSIFSRSIDTAAWTQHDVPTLRRDSGYSSTMADEDLSETDASNGRSRRGSRAGNSKKSRWSPIKYTTDLEIPFTIPTLTKKFFIPSFHSCLISRTYTLQLSLSVGPTGTAVTLSIPFQVGVEMIHEPHGSELPSFESLMAQADEEETEAHLQPRFMHTPESNIRFNNLLPQYESSRQPILSIG
ncbi:hypothetical protein PT974_00644 [Cladobotryum mycophilum]|uniref:Bul1 C-terminal domain-containing protein n=1 Tax=Cladobotryum mycophilum TaxID=491253 RepID=A0ABR0T2P3_9HYPO